MQITFLFVTCLFFAVWFTLINTVKMVKKVTVPAGNLFLQAAGIVGVIVHIIGM